MSRTTRYHTLTASLPHLPDSYDQDVALLSPARLEERLKMLQAEDNALLARILEQLKTHQSPSPPTESEPLPPEAFPSDRNDDLTPTIRFCLDVREIVGALRLRKRGQQLTYRFGRLHDHLVRHWQHPAFKLNETYPWIEGVRLALEEDNVMTAEKRVRSILWDHLRRRSFHHFFDLNAVVFYVLRLDLARSWKRRNDQEGKTKFEALLKEALQDHDQLF